MRTYRIMFQGEVIAESDCPYCDVTMGVLHGPCTVTPAYEKVRAYFKERPDGTMGDPVYEAEIKRYFDEIKGLNLEALRSDGHQVESVGIGIDDLSGHLPEDEAYYMHLLGCDPDTVHGWLDDHPEPDKSAQEES